MGKRGVLVAWLAGGLCACSTPPVTENGPVVVDVSSHRVVMGETFEVLGHGFLHGEEGSTRLAFTGVFEASDGTVSNVDYVASPIFGGRELGGDEREILSVARFGPFANPFTGDARTGVFRGKVAAVVESSDGVVSRGQGLTVDLEVGPSVVIEVFEPLEADCGAPAPRALAGIPYRLRVRATGLKAVRYVYEISNVNGQPGITTFEHAFNQPPPGDRVGEDPEDGPLLFNPIAEDVQHAVSVITITAYDAQGHAAQTVLPVTVHRPLEVRYDGTIELAERYEPEPVSGCIPGSIDSRVEYQESVTEVRLQSVAVTVSTEWLRSEGRSLSRDTIEGIEAGESRSRAEGVSEWEGENISESQGVSYRRDVSNDVDFASENGESWGWNLAHGESNEVYESRMNMIFGEGSWEGTVGVEAEGSIPGFAKVSGGVETTVGVSAGASTEGTQGSRRARNVSEGWSAGGSLSEGRSFGTTVAENRSESVEGTYAVSRSRERTAETEETISNTRTWAFGQGVSTEEVVAQGDARRVEEALQTSHEVSTTQGLAGSIPRGRYGVFYRQTTRFVRRAEVRSYDLCGLASHAGELQFNEWTWAAGLAVGPTCDALPPPSNLPKARCFVSPCGG